MKRQTRNRLVTAVATAAVGIALGSPVLAQTVPVQAPEDMARAAGLAPVDHGSFDQFYLRPGADLSRYQRVLVAPVEVSIERGRDELVLDDRTVKHAKKEFAEELAEALGPAGMAADKGPGVAVLEITVTDFTPNNPAFPRRRPPGGGIIDESIGIGDAAFQAVVRDGASGEVVAVIADADVGLPLTSNVRLHTEFGDADRFVERWSDRIADLFNAGSGS